MHRTGICLAIAVALISAVPGMASAADQPPAASRAPGSTDQLIVTTTTSRVSDASVEAATESAAAGLGLDINADVTRDATRTTSIVRLDEWLPIESVEQLASQLTTSDVIVRAEPDIILHPSLTLPNDPYTSSEWGLWQSPTGGVSTRAPEAWARGRGAGVVVAVLDTGITAHPDLDAHVVAGYDFIDDVWTANDGGLRDSDASDPGDWITEPEEIANGYYRGVPNCPEGNSSWHGTHVAGTIAAVTDNSIGVSGIAPDARIQPVRVLGKCGGYLSDIADAVRWAAGGTVSGVTPNPKPARVINMSLGGGGACDTYMQSAIDAAIALGTSVVVAAGNANRDASSSVPANCSGVVTVAAHDSSGGRASFSNYGSMVEVSGPGVGIWSTLNAGATSPASPTYASYNGTSMATPHVAGVVALLLSAKPSLTSAEVTSILQSTAQAFPVGTSCAGICGSGYVDAQAALASLSPGPPGTPAVTADYDELDVTWAAPTRGLQPAWYAIQYSANGTTWTNDDTTTTRSATIDALNPATAYLVRVRSVLGDDSSAWATSAVAVQPLPPVAPGPVTGITPLPMDDTTLSVTWTPPVSTGGRPITHYLVQHSADDSTWLTDDTTTTASTTLVGLAPGIPVRMRVSAVNVMGASTPATSTILVAPRTLAAPGAPGPISVTPGNASLAIRWAAPIDNGGRTVTSYVVQHSTDDSTWTALTPVATTSTTITGLANGRAYSVRVAATSTQGTGAWTTATGTPVAPPPPPPEGGGGVPPPAPPPVITKPGAPAIVDTGVDDGSVRVAWTVSDDTGGELPTAFTVEISGPQGTTSRETSEASIEVTDLVNGTPYSVRVAATNSAGTGAWSARSEDLVPRGPATSPTSLVAVAGDKSALLSWLVPQDDGGSAVSEYVIEVSARGATQELMVDDTATVLLGLANGVPHTIRVAAETDFGLGAWSAAVTVTPKAPAVTAPRTVKAVRIPRRVSVTWSAPELGSPLRYIVTASIDGRPFRVVSSTKETSAAFPVKSTARTVRVQVAAVDRYGKGPATAPITSRRP